MRNCCCRMVITWCIDLELLNKVKAFDVANGVGHIAGIRAFTGIAGTQLIVVDSRWRYYTHHSKVQGHLSIVFIRMGQSIKDQVQAGKFSTAEFD